jgi:hypothetical protein
MCRWAVTVIAWMLPVLAHGQALPVSFDLTPYAGGISPDKPWHARGTAPLYGLAMGTELSALWQLELDVNDATLSDRTDAAHSSLYGGALTVSRVFNRDGWCAPFVSFGAGLTRYVPPANLGISGRTEFMAEPGIGAFVSLWRSADRRRSLALRPAVSLRWTHGWAHAPGNPVDPLYAIGLTYTQRWGR